MEQKILNFHIPIERSLSKDGGKVKIIPSFSVVILDVPVDDFKEGTKRFFQKVVQDVMKKNKALK